MTLDHVARIDLLLGGFILLCLIVTLLLYAVSAFDLRSLAPWRRWGEARRLDVYDRPDATAIIAALTLLAVAMAVWLGWRAPMEIERLYGSGGQIGAFLPEVRMSLPGRVAQVVGAVCAGLIVLRLLRPVLVFAGFAVLAALSIAAFGYVLG